MGTLSRTTHTFSDFLSLLDPNGMKAEVVKVLNQENGILDDIQWAEGNLPTGNQTTIQGSKSSLGTRRLNSGAGYYKSSQYQVVDTCCLLEGNSDIDVKVLQLQNDKTAYRLEQDLNMISGTRDTVANMLFHGDTEVDPDTFNGLDIRYNTMKGAKKGNKAWQVVDAGGTGVNMTSAYLVNWGRGKVRGIYPKGTEMGLKIQDMGKIRVSDEKMRPYWVYSTNVTWELGLAVENYRSIARLCNIDTDKLKTAGEDVDNAPKLFKHMILAKNRIPNELLSNSVWYVSDTLYSYIEVMLDSKANVWVTRDMIMGQSPALRVRGIRVVKCDSLTDAESKIV